MEFTGQRNKKQFIDNNKITANIKQDEDTMDKFLVKSKQTLISKILSFAFSLFMWFYMLIVLFFFISACFDYNDYSIGLLKTSFNMFNSDIRSFLAVAFILFLLFFISLLAWKYYNKIKFGSLNRRSMQKETTDEEMLGLNLVNSETYEKLKKEKVIVFEKNPIKELTKGE